MPDLTVTLVLPNGGGGQPQTPGGGRGTPEVPEEVRFRHLPGELTPLLRLPTIGPDGRPMGYRIDSKALGRELREEESLAAAGGPNKHRLILTADITAGARASEHTARTRHL